MDEVDETTSEKKLIWYSLREVCLMKNDKKYFKLRIEWKDERKDISDEKLYPKNLNRQKWEKVGEYISKIIQRFRIDNI